MHIRRKIDYFRSKDYQAADKVRMSNNLRFRLEPFLALAVFVGVLSFAFQSPYSFQVTLRSMYQNIPTWKDYIQKEAKVLDTEEMNSSALTYFRQPKKVVKLVADCVLDDKCHLVLLHVPKCAGSTLEYQFYNMFRPDQLTDPKIMPKSGSCCHNTMMTRYNANKLLHCRAKVSSYTVSVNQYLGVVNECRTILEDEKALTKVHIDL